MQFKFNVKSIKILQAEKLRSRVQKGKKVLNFKRKNLEVQKGRSESSKNKF